MSGEVQELARAVAVLRSGGLVAFPTETVYGLGADASQPDAVRRVFEVKGRPADHPLIVHVGSAAQLADWARDIPAAAWKLAEAFWPGPLTLVLKRSQRVPDVVTGGADTVGVRVPSHPLALALLQAFGGGVAAPSANRFGAVSPTSAAHVRADLGDAVDVVLDGGDSGVGVESTIVDLTGSQPTILRPGGVSRERIIEVLGRDVPVVGSSDVAAPGTLPFHYAPRARVVVVSSDDLEAQRAAWQSRAQKVGTLHAAAADSLEDVARGLYAQLRALDAQGCDVILVTLPRERGIGLAIADRLRKAAGPRPGSSD